MILVLACVREITGCAVHPRLLEGERCRGAGVGERADHLQGLGRHDVDPGLSVGDVQNLQALYGPSMAGRNDAGNTQYAATRLMFEGPEAVFEEEITRADADYFMFRTDSGASGYQIRVESVRENRIEAVRIHGTGSGG